VTEPVGRPAYQQVADDLRRRIGAGEFPVGSVIPSTAKLTRVYGCSVTVVRAAVAQLQADEVLVGQPGKGVFVRATPAAAAEEAATVVGLARRIDGLQADVQRMEVGLRAESAAEVAALRQYVQVLRVHIADLYAQLGKAEPETLTAVPEPDQRSAGEGQAGLA
jgi:GntR family transcriptional regulator